MKYFVEDAVAEAVMVRAHMEEYFKRADAPHMRYSDATCWGRFYGQLQDLEYRIKNKEPWADLVYHANLLKNCTFHVEDNFACVLVAARKRYSDHRYKRSRASYPELVYPWEKPEPVDLGAPEGGAEGAFMNP